MCELLGDWRRVLRACQQSGVGPQHVLDCIAHYRQLGDRVGPGTLYWRLKNCHPNLDADAGWQVELPKPMTTAKPNPEMIRQRTVMDGRKAGASDQRIAEVLRDRLVAAGLAPDVVEV
ncbi:hypothetical protein [Stieleria varia]|uniref:Uncharacterized protein n=1 Tax=Stieleria varia TaxID=2528005 RepID=A0A5C6AEY9_9BACT|nr:hypothetical protein [Stieleria varia]TWT98534.1 hypothetical protein Pla52n_50500 [Stieleria varia]